MMHKQSFCVSFYKLYNKYKFIVYISLEKVVHLVNLMILMAHSLIGKWQTVSNSKWLA